MSPSYRGMDPEGVARWKEIEAHALQPGAVIPPQRTPNTDAKVASITTPTLVTGVTVPIEKSGLPTAGDELLASDTSGAATGMINAPSPPTKLPVAEFERETSRVPLLM